MDSDNDLATFGLQQQMLPLSTHLRGPRIYRPTNFCPHNTYPYQQRIIDVVPAPQGGYYVAVAEDMTANNPVTCGSYSSTSHSISKSTTKQFSATKVRASNVPSSSPKHRFLARANAHSYLWQLQDRDQDHIVPPCPVENRCDQNCTVRHNQTSVYKHHHNIPQRQQQQQGGGDSSTVAVRPLPSNFVLSPTTVVLGKGSAPKEASGNRRLQRLVNEYLDVYASSDRPGKIALVSRIVCAMSSPRQIPSPQSETPLASSLTSTSNRMVNSNDKNKNENFNGFVRFHDGRWLEATEKDARTKVTSMFRDALHSQYKSSSKSKVTNRRQIRRQQQQQIKITTEGSTAAIAARHHRIRDI